jgi:hypothetical protein
MVRNDRHTILYNGKNYTVGNRYTISVNNYWLRTGPEDVPERGRSRLKAKLVLKEYEDGEGYGTDYHYGYVFEYPRRWAGTLRMEEITLPDALFERTKQ